MGRGSKAKRIRNVRKDQRRVREGLPEIYAPLQKSPPLNLEIARVFRQYMANPGYKGRENKSGGVYQGLKQSGQEVLFKFNGNEYSVSFDISAQGEISERFSLVRQGKSDLILYTENINPIDKKTKRISGKFLEDCFDRVMKGIKYSFEVNK